MFKGKMKQIVLKDDVLLELLNCLGGFRNKDKILSSIFKAGMLYQYIMENMEYEEFLEKRRHLIAQVVKLIMMMNVV